MIYEQPLSVCPLVQHLHTSSFIYYAFSGCDLRSVGLNLTTGPIWLCVNSEDMEWVEGARKCTKDGGTLVIINNEEKLNAVSGSILNIRHHSSPML